MRVLVFLFLLATLSTSALQAQAFQGIVHYDCEIKGERFAARWYIGASQFAIAMDYRYNGKPYSAKMVAQANSDEVRIITHSPEGKPENSIKLQNIKPNAGFVLPASFSTITGNGCAVFLEGGDKSQTISVELNACHNVILSNWAKFFTSDYALGAVALSNASGVPVLTTVTEGGVVVHRVAMTKIEERQLTEADFQ